MQIRVCISDQCFDWIKIERVRNPYKSSQWNEVNERYTVECLNKIKKLLVEVIIYMFW